MRNFFIILFIFISSISLAQENKRIDNISNQLEIIKLENPRFEEKLNVNISQATLSNFLIAIAKVHQINLSVSPELHNINIVNNFSDVSISDLLIFLTKEYKLNLDFTGDIISVSKYDAPPLFAEEKEIIAAYNPSQGLLTLDLQNDPLDRTFRKITDISGKNLVYAPGMEKVKLNFYISNVPFASAMNKLALANKMEVKESRDGFFVFNPIDQNIEDGQNTYTINISENFNFRILDSVQRLISVDIENIAVENVIHTLSKSLNLDIFTATPLKNLGTISVTAEKINFDSFLDKIFESVNSQTKNPEEDLSQNQGQIQNSSPNVTNINYTYKKENDIYYFGLENQLSLKQVEIVPLMHRSIELLANPTNNSEKRRRNQNTFIPGSTNYYSNTPPIDNNTSNQYNRNNSNIEKDTQNIRDIIPEGILNGIDVKIDKELNSFIVNGPATNIERFKDFIEYIDKPVPVILIEVMILEINKSALLETGVSFGLGEEKVETRGKVFPSTNIRIGAETVNRVIGGFDGFGSLNMGNVLPNFYMDIKAMESNGNLKILSTPKLSTLNGHKAFLSSGQTTYYAVTNQNFFGSQIPQTSEVTNYYPIDAELALEIMPFVSGNGEITLDISVQQSSFNGERIAEDAPPGMNSREFSSIIRMRNQDVAILGGIEQRTKDDSGTGVPLLARIPVIKWLFSERRREDSKKKLNILIKPTIIY